MNTQKGFIQILALIAIITGILVLGGAGYVGIRQYQNRQAKISQGEVIKDNKQSDGTSSFSEIEKLKQEVEELKKNTGIKNQPVKPIITKPASHHITTSIDFIENPQSSVSVENPLVKIEKCKTLADDWAKYRASSLASDAYNKAAASYSDLTKGGISSSNQTFTEQLNNLNSNIQWMRDDANSAYKYTYNQVYDSEYNFYYLNCLNKQ